MISVVNLIRQKKPMRVIFVQILIYTIFFVMALRGYAVLRLDGRISGYAFVEAACFFLGFELLFSLLADALPIKQKWMGAVISGAFCALVYSLI